MLTSQIIFLKDERFQGTHMSDETGLFVAGLAEAASLLDSEEMRANREIGIFVG